MMIKILFATNCLSVCFCTSIAAAHVPSLSDNLDLNIPCAIYREIPSPCEKEKIDATETPEELNKIITGINDFSVDLYKQLMGKAGNIFFSPYSIAAALALSYAGAEGETARQIEDTLHFPYPPVSIHSGFNLLDTMLCQKGKSCDNKKQNELCINMSNNLWSDQKLSLSPEYIDNIITNYGAKTGILDFKNTPDKARNTINTWVRDQTNGKIDQLLAPNAINPLTKLILTNTLYFNAPWQSRFDTHNTVDNALFYISKAETAQASMMKLTKRFKYYQSKEYQAINIPYMKNKMSMVIILPAADHLSDFEQQLDHNSINHIMERLDKKNVKLEMPRFKLESKATSLKQILQQMGMPLAFSPDADFSIISSAENLYISDVIHKSFVNVDESGTEASAATAVIFMESVFEPMETVSMKINRPFIFLIRDNETGLILFMGRLVKL